MGLFAFLRVELKKTFQGFLEAVGFFFICFFSFLGLSCIFFRFGGTVLGFNFFQKRGAADQKKKKNFNFYCFGFLLGDPKKIGLWEVGRFG